MEYRIYTVQMSNVRKVDQSKIAVLDITAKSGIKLFAPHFSDVMRYKDGHLSEEQYTDIYLRKMAESRANFRDEWIEHLTEHQDTAYICYCTPGKFCHRHLFAKVSKKFLEDLGHTVVLKGELHGAQYHKEEQKPVVEEPPKFADIDPAKKVEVVPFYSREDVLSNHHFDGFTIKGVYFNHNEKFIMYCKAKLFGDHEIAEKILKAAQPQACKVLGRQVRGYDDVVWKSKRRRFSFMGCLQKAKEHPEIKEYLLSTGNALIVEAAKFDRNWGVGLAKDDPRIYDPTQWQGLNIQGDVWMDVRRYFQNEIIF